MSTEDFVKYMMRAKGVFLSRYNVPISNIQVIENSDEVIKFEVEGTSKNGEKKTLVVSFRK